VNHKLTTSFHLVSRFYEVQSEITRSVRWARHAARTGEIRNAYKNFIGNHEGKKPRGRPKSRWEDTIRMDIRKTVRRYGLDICLSINICGGIL
jgi:hypothetical protein